MVLGKHYAFNDGINIINLYYLNVLINWKI